MAQTAPTDVFNPQVTGKQIMAQYPRNLVLANTGAVFVNPDPLTAKAGNMITVPRDKKIGSFADFTGAALTPGKYQTVTEQAYVVRRALALAHEDVAEFTS